MIPDLELLLARPCLHVSVDMQLNEQAVIATATEVLAAWRPERGGT